MTLQNFLSTFKTEGVYVTIIDNGTQLITLNASGYQCLDDTLEARVIRSWEILNPVRVNVVLESVTTT